MAERLGVGDYVALAAYFVVVLGVGIWSSFRRGKNSTEGYFLAGKHMTWLPVGASLFASNIGAPTFIGLAGAGAASGVSVVVYEWGSVFLLLALGWFFVPVYISSGAYTIPEYLMKRFGGRRLRICLSVLALALYILIKISVEIFCGAMFMQLLLGWNLYLCVIGILTLTALHTVTGGLVAVMYTDTLQTGILLIGACILTVKAFQEIGDMQGLAEGFVNAVSNTTMANTTYHACGLPPEKSMHIWRDLVTGDIPWPGALFGTPIIGLWFWCSDQLMVQRMLSARNMSHAKGGSLFAAALKILPFFLWVIPGMISRILYPDEIACSTPDECFEVCMNRAGCSNMAYPLLVLRILPEGVRGVMLAALLAALMSSLTSIFNSASSMFTMDVWPNLRKNPSNNELMIVGRIVVIVCTGIGIVWLPVMQHAQGGQLWGYLQSITAYTAPPWGVLFLLAILWKRMTEKGAFWGLIAGLVVGGVRLSLDFIYPAPFCGSGEEDIRPAVLKNVHYLHFAILLFLVTLLIMVAISLCTEPRPEEELKRTTWWTRHMEESAPLESKCVDNDDSTDTEVVGDNGGHVTYFDNDMPIRQSNTNGRGILLTFARWLCGMTDGKSPTLSREQREEIQKKFTSLEENPTAKTVLNACAIGLVSVTCFLFGYFS